MRPALASKLAGFGTTIFTEMTKLANERGAINLSQGFPDFDGPSFAKDAAIAAILAGEGQYARMSGIPGLHRALSEKYRRDWGLDYAPDEELTVTSGATEAIFAAIQGLCDAGDEVVLFEPYYDSYKASVAMAGAVPRVVTLHAPDWRFDPAEVRSAFSDRTRVLLLNSPHNPTGKVFSREELSILAELCRRHGASCVSDEVYEHLVYEGRHVPMAAIPGMRERTVTISSFGKTFSLTGWKIGWAAAPPALTNAVRSAHQFITFATATPLQHGAAAALRVAADGSYYGRLVADYRDRRDYLCRELTRIGFRLTPPDGAYFVCADFRPFGFEDDREFVRHLIESAGVAAIPPSVFYDRPERGRGYVRFAFCKKRETLEAAVERMSALRPATHPATRDSGLGTRPGTAGTR
jgi:N-succinyldiaminopimelate aminotransferase